MNLLPLHLNWWKLHLRHDSQALPTEYAFRDFLDTVKDQFIKRIQAETNLEFLDFAPVLSAANWRRLSKPDQLDRQVMVGRFFPILTLHGTGAPETRNSIVRNGYKLPGYVIEETGFQLGVSTGTYLGEGVYTTTHPEKAHWYTDTDSVGQTQLIVNLVILGSVQHLSLKQLPLGIDVPENGMFQGEYHTRMLPDQLEVVSASGDYVIPIAIGRVKIKDAAFFEAQNRMNIYLKQRARNTHEKLEAIHLFANFHALKAPVQQVPVTLAQYVVAPVSLDKTTLKQIDDFVANLHGQLHTVEYGERSKFRKLKLDERSHYAEEISGNPAENLALGIDTCLDKVVQSEEHPTFVVIHIFVNKPTSSNEDLDGVVQKWRELVRSRQNFIVKLIFLNESITRVPVGQIWSQPYYRVKDRLQTDFVWEDAYHCLWQTSSGLGPLLNYVTRQVHLLYRAKLGHWRVHDMERRLGDGFVVDVTEEPRHFAQTFESYILYKGRLPEYITFSGSLYKIVKTNLLTQRDLLTLDLKPAVPLSEYKFEAVGVRSKPDWKMYRGRDGLKYVSFNGFL